jgi:hypothetical protein
MPSSSPVLTALKFISGTPTNLKPVSTPCSLLPTL